MFVTINLFWNWSLTCKPLDSIAAKTLGYNGISPSLNGISEEDIKIELKKAGLPENGKVTLTVYNSLGQRVGTLVNTKQVAGAYEVNFNASNLASGVYLYRVTVEGSKNFVMTKKMILMK